MPEGRSIVDQFPEMYSYLDSNESQGWIPMNTVKEKIRFYSKSPIRKQYSYLPEKPGIQSSLEESNLVDTIRAALINSGVSNILFLVVKGAKTIIFG